MPPVRVFRRRAGSVRFLRQNPPGKGLGGAPDPKRTDTLSPATLAGGGGKPPHRCGGAPCHLHCVAAKPDPGLRPPGEPPVSGPEPGGDPPAGVQDHSSAGIFLPGKAPAGEGPVHGRCSWFLQKPGPVDAENPRPGESSSRCGMSRARSKACKSAWTMWRNGSSAGYPAMDWRRAAAPRPGSTLRGNPGPWFF